MEVEEIQTKFPRIMDNGTSRIDSTKITQKGKENYPDDEEDGVAKNTNKRGGRGSGGDFVSGGVGSLCGWPTSRIFRVSRASGGKDRHSKVWTSKGLRDRRVRLSVSTAIQFYDLQDRLGCDQPSKAIEWLLKTAASSISELPSINTSFPDTPKQFSDEKRSSAGTDDHQPGFDSAEVEMDGGDANFQQQNQQIACCLSKSGCSSPSETSKGSGLSLSRSESRIKARERARGRAAEKEKEKENESRITPHLHQQNVNPISQNSSFTELLTSGINANFSNNNTTSITSPNESGHQNHASSGGGEGNLFQKSSRQWSSTGMDYFSPVMIGPSSSSQTTHHSTSGFSGQIQMGNSLPPFSVAGDHQNHQEQQQHFSFVPDHHLVPVATAAGTSDYNLSFTISSGLAGYNRGTLQSNSPSLLPQLQRFSPIDGSNSNVPFFIGTVAPNNAIPVENHHHHHHFTPGFDGRLQLYPDPRGKGKN